MTVQGDNRLAHNAAIIRALMAARPSLPEKRLRRPAKPEAQADPVQGETAEAKGSRRLGSEGEEDAGGSKEAQSQAILAGVEKAGEEAGVGAGAEAGTETDKARRATPNKTQPSTHQPAKGDSRRARRNRKAVLNGAQIIESGPGANLPATLSTLEIMKRIDGFQKSSPITPELAQAIRATYEQDLHLNYNDLCKAIGVGMGTVVRAIEEAPGLSERVRQRRAALITAALEASLSAMAVQLLENVTAGKLQPNEKNMRDWAVAFGILTDKRQLLAGGATARHEVLDLTPEARKQALQEKLNQLEEALGTLTGK